MKSIRQNIRVEINYPLYTVVIDRPEVKNSIDRQTADELAEAFRAFDRDSDASVAVLYGDHGIFCSGADLKAIAGGNTNRMEPEGDGPLGPTRMALSKPVIAAVAGYAVAGGLELACWCDLRVVEESAVFGVFCRRFGVPLIDGGTLRLPRLIGMSRAMDMILTGRPVEAAEALQMGLANRVVQDKSARAEAEQLARQIASFPQTCMRHDRLSALEQADMPFAEALVNEYHHGIRTLESGEYLEGSAAFTSGRGKHGRF